MKLAVHVDWLCRPYVVNLKSSRKRFSLSIYFGSDYLKYFLRELTLSSTLDPNPKRSHSVDPQFSHKLLFFSSLIA